MKKVDLKNYDLIELEDFFRTLNEPSFRAKQLFQAIYAQNKTDFDSISTFPKRLRQRLKELAFISNLQPSEVLTAQDGTIKFLFGLEDGHHIESVLIPQKGYYTLCVSTQVGCAQGCRFCLTGQMGFKRHLTTAEIVGQVTWAKSYLLKKKDPWALRNVVFMGMGEPLHNYANTLKACKILLNPLGLGLSHRRLTISTVGIVSKMLEMAKELNVSWAISLHAPDNETRNLIVPANRKYPIEQIIQALRQMPLPPRKRFTIEYVLLKGINDTKKHAQKLTELLKGLPVKINLIPFNPHSESNFERPSSKDILIFAEVLQKAGYTVTIRHSKGADIGAACGQLDGRPMEAVND